MTDQTELDDKNRDKPLVIDLLRETMFKWEYGKGENWLLIKRLIRKLEYEGEIRLAAQIRKTWRDLDDRFHKIAGMVLEFESPKLSRMDIKKNTEHRFVIEAPKTIKPYKQGEPTAWIEAIEKEKLAFKLLENKGNGKAK